MPIEKEFLSKSDLSIPNIDNDINSMKKYLQGLIIEIESNNRKKWYENCVKNALIFDEIKRVNTWLNTHDSVLFRINIKTNY